MTRLVEYFTRGVGSYALAETIGMEVETQFLDRASRGPMTREISQLILQEFARQYGWTVTDTRGRLVTEISSPAGDKMKYELGRHNMEVISVPLPPRFLVPHVRGVLTRLYAVVAPYGASPFFGPVVETDEDVLIIPDERDQIWVELDGREPLNLLARSSAVQFTIDVPVADAIRCLNSLGRSIDRFLADYPQERLWRRYIRESRAGYDLLRYGGPLAFDSLHDYCVKLSHHAVVSGTRLVDFENAANFDIPLFLRSVWWYFRLKRYGEKLCIEVRPLARRGDEDLMHQLDFVMGMVSEKPLNKDLSTVS